jgi:predicted RNase H-like HicB family nuclease
MLKTAFHTLVSKEGKYFVAKCLEIELTSQGKTKKKALTNLKEALELYFQDEKVEKILPSLLLKNPQLETICFSY